MTRPAFDSAQAAGAWIQERPWDWWITLTFTANVGRGYAIGALRTWLKILARDVVCAHVTAAWGLEEQGRGVLHFHLLLFIQQNKNLFRQRLMRDIWRHQPHGGLTSFAKYDAKRGAAFYLVKGGDWDIGIACPRKPQCRRPRKGCVEAHGAW